MRKEMIVAIVFGLILGLVLTYGFYRARLAMGPRPNPIATPTPGTSASPTPNNNGQLTLLSPADESVQAERSTTITGKTIPNTTVVILVNDDEEITMADATGNFSQQRTLKSGSNVITITVLEESGALITAERTVIVANPEGLNPSPTASASGQSNR